MNEYTIIKIYEADYGCEENSDGIEKALLKLVSVDDPSDERFIELTESEIAEKGFAEGVRVSINSDGSLSAIN